MKEYIPTSMFIQASVFIDAIYLHRASFISRFGASMFILFQSTHNRYPTNGETRH